VFIIIVVVDVISLSTQSGNFLDISSYIQSISKSNGYLKLYEAYIRRRRRGKCSYHTAAAYASTINRCRKK